MEVLRHLRSRGGALTTLAQRRRRILLIVAAAFAGTAISGWWYMFGGRGDRSSVTADTAVVQASGGNDSGGVYVVRPPDSLVTVGRDTSTPPVSFAFPNPASILAADSISGQRLYRRTASCIACHGASANGVAGLGSNLTDSTWASGSGSLSFIYNVLRDGVLDPATSRVLMPGVRGQLTSTEIFQIAAYVYTLSRAGVTVSDSASLAAGAPPIAVPPPDTASRS